MTDRSLTEGARLKSLVNKAMIRNCAASMIHFDAAAMAELPVGAPRSEEDYADRYARMSIEGAICWRDLGRSCRWPR